MTMNLADPELELIDPTPNMTSMFLHFDKTFFRSRLSSRCVIRWSKKMYSCAGTCTYEGGIGGLCIISLSEPLLKLRPRKDFVETLLHEMIHAYLFVTRRDKDRGGHGPKFQAHMHRINAATGLSITIYHDFHDEVKLYQTHWWRCTGRCQFMRPHFGIVRRSCNRPPGRSEPWWYTHKATCGGTFIKIKEPEKHKKKPVMSNENGDIRKYVNKNNGIEKNINKKPVLKDSNKAPINPKVDIENKNTSTFNSVFNDASTSINNGVHTSTTSSDVRETVRNIWSNKQIASNSIPKDINSNNLSNLNNHELDVAQIREQVLQRYKSSSVIKEVYGEDCDVMKQNFVDCPVCDIRIDSDEINKHLDECLNKELIEKLSQESNPLIKHDSYVTGLNQDCPVDRGQLRADDLIPESRTKESIDRNRSKAVNNKQVPNIDTIDLTNNNFVIDVRRKRPRSTFDHDDLKPTEQIISFIDKKNKFRKSDSFVGPSASNILEVTSPIMINSQENDPGTSEYRSKSKISASDVEEDTPSILIDLEKNEPGSDEYNSKSLIDMSTSMAENVCKLNTKTEQDSSKLDATEKIQETEPGCSDTRTMTDIQTKIGDSECDLTQKACPCCGDELNKSLDEHLDECFSFFEDTTTTPQEGASSSHATIVIDDAEIDLDESQMFNATGTKYPCPCCMKMIEEIDMNTHLDICLVNGSSGV